MIEISTGYFLEYYADSRDTEIHLDENIGLIFAPIEIDSEYNPFPKQ